MLRALLFDLDGTLADTDPLHFAGWQEALGAHAIPLDHAAYRARISGRINPEIVRDFLPNLSPSQSQAFTETKERWFRERLQALEPTAGLVALLAWAAERQLPTALVTNAPRDNARHMLEALHLGARFSPVVLAGELARGKPDPLPYRVALEALGVSGADSLAFEDSPAGLHAAVAAGIPTVGLTTTHGEAELRAAGAILAVPDFAAPALSALLAARLA